MKRAVIHPVLFNYLVYAGYSVMGTVEYTFVM